MSSSWTREPTVRPGERTDRATDRAQTPPVVALVALFAVCAGVSLYATVLGGAMPTSGGRNLADPALNRVHDAVSDGGVVDPVRLDDARDRGPSGRRLNVSLSTGARRWSVGPAVPPASSGAVDRAGRLVSVRLGPGRVVAGRLSVVVWS